jgi:cytochrome c-type biogenesis protein CcmH/NrfG
MEAFAAGRLDEAATFWRRALRVDPRDPRALAYLQRAQQQMSRTREILGSN